MLPTCFAELQPSISSVIIQHWLSYVKMKNRGGSASAFRSRGERMGDLLIALKPLAAVSSRGSNRWLWGLRIPRDNHALVGLTRVPDRATTLCGASEFGGFPLTPSSALQSDRVTGAVAFMTESDAPHFTRREVPVPRRVAIRLPTRNLGETPTDTIAYIAALGLRGRRVLVRSSPGVACVSDVRCPGSLGTSWRRRTGGPLRRTWRSRLLGAVLTASESHPTKDGRGEPIRSSARSAPC